MRGRRKQKREKKAGGRERERARESGSLRICYLRHLRSWGYLPDKHTELIRVIARAVSATAVSCERAGKGRSLRACAEPSLHSAAQGVWGGGLSCWASPRGPRTPGAHQVAAFSAAAQPKPRVAPASAALLVQWLRRTQSVASEQKPLLG